MNCRIIYNFFLLNKIYKAVLPHHRARLSNLLAQIQNVYTSVKGKSYICCKLSLFQCFCCKLSSLSVLWLFFLLETS